LFGDELGARELNSAVPNWSGDSKQELQSRAQAIFCKKKKKKT
jgi:hypothetical protein